MQTRFTPEQLENPETRTANTILRSCVHCGFCTATCPTYVTLGDELDSPRGRIYLIKEMLEDGGAATPQVAQHLDRCLSCLSCMTTCPSGVDYMHLIDMAREHVEETHRRPLFERLYREVLGFVLPRPALFRLTLQMAALAQPFKALFPRSLRPALEMAPRKLPPKSLVDRPQVFPASGPRRARVALLSGCAQQVIEPSINVATIRLLTRHGVEVVIAQGVGCCGALQHHLGQHDPFAQAAQRNIDAWIAEADTHGLDAIIINASGCGTVVKDYGHIFRDDPQWAARAKRVSAMTRDITEFLPTLDLKPTRKTGQIVAYHSACSMQHGQRILTPPKALLGAAGFSLRDIPEGHLCCGSAGTYNLLQPDIAAQLRTRKLANIATTKPQAIATGNIGCIAQLRGGASAPVLHTVELLDWATGGPLPEALTGRPGFDDSQLGA